MHHQLMYKRRGSTPEGARQWSQVDHVQIPAQPPSVVKNGRITWELVGYAARVHARIPESECAFSQDPQATGMVTTVQAALNYPFLSEAHYKRLPFL